MSEYKVSKKKTCKFLKDNLGPLLRRSGSPQLKLALNSGAEQSQVWKWSAGKAVPTRSDSLIKLYAAASATDDDYTKLRTIITVDDEELAMLRKNTPVASKKRDLSVTEAKGKMPKIKTWNTARVSPYNKFIRNWISIE